MPFIPKDTMIIIIYAPKKDLIEPLNLQTNHHATCANTEE